MSQVDGRRDQERDEQAHDPEHTCDRLTLHEVVRIARDIEPRDSTDRPEPVRDECEHGKEQEPIQTSHDAADIDSAEDARLQRSGSLSRSGDQSVVTRTWVPPLTPKNCSNTRRAAGAAAVEPWPPFSMTAQTTRRASSDGP